MNDFFFVKVANFLELFREKHSTVSYILSGYCFIYLITITRVGRAIHVRGWLSLVQF